VGLYFNFNWWWGIDQFANRCHNIFANSKSQFPYDSFIRLGHFGLLSVKPQEAPSRASSGVLIPAYTTGQAA
jgi:hypothetical protein